MCRIQETRQVKNCFIHTTVKELRRILLLHPVQYYRYLTDPFPCKEK